MKIVVYHSDEDGWAWKIVQPKVGVIAVSNRINYERKSDAKRGAERFENKLWEAYVKADECKVDGGCMIPVEVIK